MSRHYNLWQDGAGWFWTSTIVEWTPVLRSPRAAALLLSIWDSRRERFGVRILGYVVMPEHGLPVTTDEAFLAKLAYMHSNPVRRGLCQTPEDWLFSSAS